MGIGRFGGTQGPLLAAGLAASGWNAGGIFLALGLILVFAAIVIVAMHAHDIRRRPTFAVATLKP